MSTVRRAVTICGIIGYWVIAFGSFWIWDSKCPISDPKFTYTLLVIKLVTVGILAILTATHVHWMCVDDRLEKEEAEGRSTGDWIKEHEAAEHRFLLWLLGGWNLFLIITTITVFWDGQIKAGIIGVLLCIIFLKITRFIITSIK